MTETTVVTLPTEYISVYVDAPTPVLVPSYASACSGSVRYVSACSCAGITADTTTLPASAVEITYTNTIYYTPITTLTITESASSSYPYDSSSSYHYDSSTSYSHGSSSSYSHGSSSSYSHDSSSRSSHTSTSVSSSSSSSTSTTSSSSTSTPTSDCNIYELKANFQYSNFKGQYLQLTQDYNFAHTLSFTPTNTHDSSFLFTLLPSGQFQGVEGTGAWVSEQPSSNSSLIYQVTPSSPLNDHRYPVICELVGGSERAVVCKVNGYETMLQTCGYDNSRLAQSTAGFQCTVVDLVAVPACI